MRFVPAHYVAPALKADSALTPRYPLLRRDQLPDPLGVGESAVYAIDVVGHEESLPRPGCNHSTFLMGPHSGHVSPSAR
jgi:hypothetical protein